MIILFKFNWLGDLVHLITIENVSFSANNRYFYVHQEIFGSPAIFHVFTQSQTGSA